MIETLGLFIKSFTSISLANLYSFYYTRNSFEKIKKHLFKFLVQTSQQCYISGNPVVSCVISPEGSVIHESRDESNGKMFFPFPYEAIGFKYE
jgi:hypothetical protein